MTPLSVASGGLLDRGALPALCIAVHGLLHGTVIPPQPEASHQPGGGYYRPIIYLDEEGRPVSLEERRRQREATTDPVSEEPPVALSQDVMQALMAGLPGADPAQLLAMLESVERRLMWSDFDRQSAAEVAAQDDEALALLMLL